MPPQIPLPPSQPSHTPREDLGERERERERSQVVLLELLSRLHSFLSNVMADSEDPPFPLPLTPPLVPFISL